MSYKEKIKTIYIDPPYNTWNDGFLYKDNMKHATWLTMMENRLRLARELMREDWVIFTSIDDNEVYNLKKLENMIFGNENINSISIKMSELSWVKMSNIDKKFPKLKEYILYAFKKNIKLFPIFIEKENLLEYYQSAYL